MSGDKGGPLDRLQLQAEVDKAFELYDEDNSGTLDTEEARKYLMDWMKRNAKDEEALDIKFEDIDENGDGEIDKAELLQFLIDQRMLHSEVF